MVLVRGAAIALIASGALLGGCSTDRPFGPTVGDVFGSGRSAPTDAQNVTVSKEVRDSTGGWTGAPVAAQTETDLENAILTKARQLNLQNAG